MGELRFPGKDLVMSGINGSFFELPGLPILSPPERLPELFFSTGKWKKDGIPLKIDKITAVYPVMVPQKAHIVLSDAVPNAFKNKFPNLKTEDFPLSFLATNVVWKRKGVLQERSRGKVMAEDLFKTNQQ
ncbi:hypothetical protein FRUB_08857 [Fimbriiglobus ruber]|uniref:Uncharacterized protein n=1 Tax=Fimbriiglobus ruber TaxID=1908690 RepID=A0A225D9F4_9BACT|nr:hypothetical protein FRUB_08857 [Fimbriiglobus ruber]